MELEKSHNKIIEKIRENLESKNLKGLNLEEESKVNIALLTLGEMYREDKEFVVDYLKRIRE